MGIIFGPIGYIFNLIITFPIFNALMLLYRLVGDFGLAIIILTLVVKLILFPLTLKQLKSMKATQVLQPQMAEIRKKYAKDKQAQALALNALYKEYGVNPVAGSCLPLLIQMPVLFGMFYAFRQGLPDPSTLHTAAKISAALHSINSQLYPFITPFLKLPDTRLSWFTFLNPHWYISLGVADPTHILPILAALATFIQLRMSQPVSVAKSNDPTNQQMKIMQYISPLMVLFFGWSYAAGLALYWTVTSIFGMFQQYFVTGWGSLFIAPNLTSKNSPANSNGAANGNTKSFTGDQGKDTRILARNDEPTSDDGAASRPTGAKYGTAPARRRSRSGSSSARRRSSNTIPRRNPSRS